MTQQQSPDEIRRDIERTRSELAYDVDTLHEKVSPRAVAGRRVDSVKGAVGGLKDKVMGSSSGVHSAGDAMHSGLDSTRGAISSAGDAVTSAPSAAWTIAWVNAVVVRAASSVRPVSIASPPEALPNGFTKSPTTVRVRVSPLESRSGSREPMPAP